MRVISGLVITADDFGYSSAVNDGIRAAVTEGLVTQTSVMANMPSFENACAFAREDGFDDRVGLHGVLTEGVPLTDAIRRLPRFCDGEGRFVRWHDRTPLPWPSSAEMRAVAAELTAQVDRCRSQGLEPSHLDSHHHVHFSSPRLLRAFMAVARAAGIPRLRMARVPFRHDSRLARIGLAQLVRRSLNRAISESGLAATEGFGTVSDFRRIACAGRTIASFEVMTHPLMAEDDRLLDAVPPSPLLRDLLDGLVLA